MFDLLLLISEKTKTEQQEWVRARFIASAMADTSKIRFPWEKPLREPSKPIDKEKLESLKMADQQILKQLRQNQ